MSDNTTTGEDGRDEREREKERERKKERDGWRGMLLWMTSGRMMDAKDERQEGV